LLSSRIYSSLDSTSYELDNFNGLIKQFPSSSVIFSNKLIPYYLEEPTSAYRMEDDNYIIVAKSSPSYYEPYSVDVSTKQITFKLVDPSDANYGLETINNFSPFGIRYSNLDNSQIEKDSYVFLKENASYNKSKKWDIYIGDTNNNV
jgi:hypothetical protein